MKAYKGFNRSEDGTLSCLGFVYEPGKTYKHEGEIEVCVSGFHACHDLWQTWAFYPNNGNNEFWEVECGGEIMEGYDSSGKFACSEITLVKKVDMDEVLRFEDLYFFHEGFAKVDSGRKYNFINKEGKVLSNEWFDNAGFFSEGLAPIGIHGKYNFIDTEGKIKFGQWFYMVGNFFDGFAVVGLDGKYNFINTEGKFLSKRWFDKACSFYRGPAVVMLDGKYNYINTEGKLLSEQWFDYALSFVESLAHVKLDGKWMKINTKGELI
jgi:hypothetical protein